MKKMAKIFGVILCVGIMLSFSYVFAAKDYTKPVDPNDGNNGNDVITGVTGLTNKIWATAITIVQVLAVGCVVFAGVRYMYASADKKADIKKGMMYLAIGSIFVFATTTVMKFIYNAGSSLL